MECENCSVPIPDLFNYTHKVSHMHTCLHFFHTHKHMIVSLVPELQKQCFASFFPLLSPPTTHTHTHAHSGPLGQAVIPQLPLLWEKKYGNSAHIYLIFSNSYYMGACMRGAAGGNCLCRGSVCGTLKSHPCPHQSAVLFLFTFAG